MKPNATLEQHINSFLPPELRVWKIIRVQGGFNPRTTCDGRRYEYAFPSYCLLPPRPATALGQMASTKGGLKLWDNDVPPNSKADPSQVSAQSFWQTFPLDGKKSESGAEKHAPEMELRRAFRLKQSSPHLLDALREASQLYIGNHNFHNFTNDKAFTDRSAMRQIKSIEVRLAYSILPHTTECNTDLRPRVGS